MNETAPIKPSTASPALRVLALIDHFVEGGAELLLSRFAAAAPTVGIDLSVACLTDRGGNPAAEPLRKAGVEPINLSARERLGPSALTTVREYLKRSRPDLVHTHLISSDVLGGVAARSVGIPVVSTLHIAFQAGDHRAKAKRMIAARTRRHACARVIAVSEAARAEYLAEGWDRPEHVVTIHNGFDLDIYPGAGSDVRRELGIPANVPVIGTVSALRPVKGHRVLLQAYAALRERFGELRLVIVGDGDERRAIESQAHALGPEVILTGSRSDVTRVLDAFDVFVQPSYAEQFSGSVLEAMAASVPVVATDVGGIREQLDDGRAGMIVPAPPEPVALERGISALLEDPERRFSLAQAARGRYRSLFTTGPWVSKTRGLYDQILAERGG